MSKIAELESAPAAPSVVTFGPSVCTIAMANVFEMIPAELVDACLGATKRRSARSRAYPNDSMFLLPVIMGLLMDEPYDEAYKQFALAATRLGYDVPATANNPSIVNLRARLGFEPYKYVLNELNLRNDVAHHSWCWKGLVVQCLDASYIDVDDSAENAIFGKTKTGKKEGAYPQLIAVCLVDYGTRLAKAIELGTRCTNELIIAKPILDNLKEGTLCTADRQYPSYWSIVAATASGAEILWRVSDSFNLEPVRYLDDGSYIAHVYEYDVSRHRTGQYIEVRVIAYTVDDEDEQQLDEQTASSAEIRLVTSILDPSFATAEELASLYPLRYYTSEGFFRELKTVLGGKRKVLRSKSPAFVVQELYGIALGHWISRFAIVKAAEKHDKVPLRLSFTNAVRVIRRTMINSNEPSVPLGSDFPPSKSI